MKITFTMTKKTAMVIIGMMICCSFLIHIGTANAQNLNETKLSISFKNETLSGALLKLELASKFPFSYDKNALVQIKIADADFVQEPLNKILDKLLAGSGQSYEVLNKNIVIGKVNPKSPNEPAGQGPGTIKGRIVEFETSQPLPGASVFMVELKKGVQSDENGYYKFTGVPAGKYTLQVSYISFTTEKLQVTISANKEATYDVKLQGSNQLTEVVVKGVGKSRAPVAHTTEKQVLQEIKSMSIVASGISSQQISKSADRNAAEVVQRVAGVTTVDDKFVIVRGLNPRYNLTYLNDNTAPSTEIYTRGFALDLIPSRIIDKILVYKSPSPENLADATGGVVKIYTKDAKTVKHFDIELQTGIRGNTAFNQNFLTYKGGKFDFLGFDDGTRALPSAVPNYDQLSLAKLTPSQYANAFSPVLSYQKTTALPNVQITANYYNSFKVAKRNISSLTSLSYKNEYLKVMANRQQGNSTVSYNTTDQTSTDDKNTQTGQINLLQNFTLHLADSSTISFKNFLLQQGINNTIVRQSWRTAADGADAALNKDNILSFNQRFLYAGNIGGNHFLNKGRHRLQWNVGHTFSRQSTPDLRVIRLTESPAFATVGDTTIQWRARGLNMDFTDGNYVVPLKLGIISRLWMRNSEGNYNASLDYTYRLKPWLTLRAGSFQQWKERRLFRRIYTVHEGDMEDLSGRVGSGGKPHGPGDSWWLNSQLVRFREQDLPHVWSEKYLNDVYTGLRVADRTTGSDSYTGTEQNNSGYAALLISPANRKVEVYGGMRYEYNRQKIGAAIPASDNFPGSINYPVYIDNPMSTWLPSVNVSWRPNSSWVFRTAYGKTVNRTEFREVAPYKELDYENNTIISGNIKLKSAKVSNYDFRAEYYPKGNQSGEVISAGIFYKELSNPIERINTSLRTTDSDFPTISFQNAARATIKGLEVEIQKKLDFIPIAPFRNISFIGNLSLIKSVTYNDTTVLASLAITPDQRALQGQAPYILNAGLYYENAGWGTKLSVIYNTSGMNIYAAGRGYEKNQFSGTTYRGSILELPRHTFDVAATQRLLKGIQVKLSIQNLLNQEIRMAEDFNFTNKYEPLSEPYVTETGTKTRDGDNISYRYKPGTHFMLNISYSF